MASLASESLVVECFAIHSRSEYYNILDPVTATFFTSLQGCASPYSLHFVKKVGLGAVGTCSCHSFGCNCNGSVWHARGKLLEICSFELIHSGDVSLTTKLVTCNVLQLLSPGWQPQSLNTQRGSQYLLVEADARVHSSACTSWMDRAQF